MTVCGGKKKNFFWTVLRDSDAGPGVSYSGVFEAATANDAIKRALHVNGVRCVVDYRFDAGGRLRFDKDEDREMYGPMRLWTAIKGTSHQKRVSGTPTKASRAAELAETRTRAKDTWL